MSRMSLGKATAIASIGLTSAIAATILTDTRTPAMRARDWVDRNRDSLPTSLDDLSAFPKEYRKEIFRILENPQRVKLWQDQLASLLTRADLELSAAQRAHIERARLVLRSPSVWESGSPANASAMALCEDVNALFTQEQASTFFHVPGEQGRLLGSLAGIGAHLNILVATAIAPLAGALSPLTGTPVSAQPVLPMCTCMPGSMCDGWGCNYTPNSCIQWDACGCFLSGPCMGLSS